MLDENTIKTSIKMFQDYVAWGNQLVPEVKTVTFISHTEENRVESGKRWDKLYTFIHNNFAAPDKDDSVLYDEVKRILKHMDADDIQHGFYDLCCKYPPHFVATALPVAYARCLLRNTKIPFDHRNTSTFKEFHKRYGSFILD